jgi:hypothetical protein
MIALQLVSHKEGTVEHVTIGRIEAHAGLHNAGLHTERNVEITQMVDAIGVMPVTISTDQSIKMRECRVVEHRNIIDKCDTLQEREGLVFKFNMQVCTTTDDT